MGLDPQRYLDQTVPGLLADPDAWNDPILRYAVDGPPGTVPDQAHMKAVAGVWARLLGSPEHAELAKQVLADSVPGDDPEFWAAAWDRHQRRAAPTAPPVTAPATGPTTAGAPPAGATVTPASEAFAEARLAIDSGALAQARRLLSSIRVVMTEAEVREAERLGAEVEARKADVSRHVDEANRLLSSASGAVSPADLERAGELLVLAAALDADDERPAQILARIPAPAPLDVTARTVGETVLLSWTPAPYRYGTVSFVALRAPAEEGALSRITATTIGTTRNSELSDTADVGRQLRYGVVAVRSGGQDSPVVEATEPVMVLAEVGDLRLQYDGVSVRGTWRRPDRCHRVEVLRAAVGDDQPTELRDGIRADGFTDPDAVDGDQLYTVRCTYLAGGHEVRSAGRTVVVSPEDAPDPVGDTEGYPEGEQYVLTWTTPTSGEVTLRSLDERPPFSVGDRMDLVELTGLGEPVAAPIEVDGTKSRVVLRSATRVAWYLPITTRGGTAVTGSAVLVDHLLPVDGLDGTRHGDEVVVTWIWPEQATDAQVVATYVGSTIFNRTVSRAEVDREGGVHIAAGPEALSVRVVAIGGAARGRRQSSPAHITVNARRPTIYWTAERRGGQTILRLVADRDCQVRRLEVVSQRHRPPDSPHDGVPMDAVEEIDLHRGETIYAPIGKVRRGMELAVFAGPHDAVHIRAGAPPMASSPTSR